jgi:hypothetical protein
MTTGYKILPHINFEGTDYTIDLKLGEFRNTEMPYLNIAFDSQAGQDMCKCANIVHCLDCRIWFMIPGSIESDEVRCGWCGQHIVIS